MTRWKVLILRKGVWSKIHLMDLKKIMKDKLFKIYKRMTHFIILILIIKDHKIKVYYNWTRKKILKALGNLKMMICLNRFLLITNMKKGMEILLLEFWLTQITYFTSLKENPDQVWNQLTLKKVKEISGQKLTWKIEIRAKTLFQVVFDSSQGKELCPKKVLRDRLVPINN